MMTNLSVTFQSFQDTIVDFKHIYNETEYPPKYPWYKYITFATFQVIISVFGLLGNGTVIWLLGFCMKRNPFTTYILNLAVADFGVLITLILGLITLLLAVHGYTEHIPLPFLFCISFASLFVYSASQLLLTAISIDRCVAVLFPIWHRCRRPPKFSTIVCAFMWVLSLIMYGISTLLVKGEALIFVLYALICYPLMIISTLTLFIKIRKRKKKKSSVAILLAQLFCLIFGLPLNFCIFFNNFFPIGNSFYYYFSDGIDFHIVNNTRYYYPELTPTGPSMTRIQSYTTSSLYTIAAFCAILNSSINPVLYFFIGREKKDHSRVSMKVRLQRVFSDEEEHREE